MKGYIYLIENKINGKKYVGKTTDTIEHRWNKHKLEANRSEHRPLYSAIQKYGSKNFEINLLEEVDFNNPEELSNREIFWIDHYNTYFGDGYNATLGGDGKILYDYEEIKELYLKVQNIQEVCRIKNCDKKTVQKILKSYDIEILDSNEVCKAKCSNSVEMLDNDGNTINIFDSQMDAARWLKEHNYTQAADLTKISYNIGRTIKGKDNRKKAYGFIWKTYIGI